MTHTPDRAAHEQPRDAGHFIRMYYARHPNGHFFDRDTLKFFGERRSEMRLLKNTVKIRDICGETHECYVISSVQRPGAPLRRRRAYHYFDVDTLTDVTI